MPESEDKKELGGLARSIDSLFSGVAAGAPVVDEPAIAVPEEPDEPAIAVPEERDTPEIAVPEEPDTPEIAVPGETDEPEVEAAPESGLAEDDMGWEPDPFATVPKADGPSERETDALPEVEADLPPEAVAARAEDEVEPSPLELAVESYSVGGSDEGRVRTLAMQHLDARDFDPVAVAVERLVLRAGDPPDSRTMELASELLTPMVRSRLLQRLGGERDEERRRGYYQVCTALGEDMALAIRDEMAEATDRFARRAYFDALVAMGDVSRPVIEAMADDDNRFLARNAVAILGEVGGPRAVELVVAALANTDPRVRREALLAMARLKVEDADQLITGLLDDSEESVRLAAVVAAGELHVERALRQLVAALGEASEDEVVLPILHALGQIGDPGAVVSIEKHAVRGLFSKPRTDVRIAAYQALNHIGTPHARRLLNQAVSDKDSEVKAVVKELLHMR